METTILIVDDEIKKEVDPKSIPRTTSFIILS